MNLLKNIYLFLFLGLLAGSCDKVVDVDVPWGKPKLVVNSLFTPDSTWKVHISESRYILDDSPIKDVTMASVKVIDENGQEITLTHTGSGIYRSTSDAPEISAHYTLNVSAAGFSGVISNGNIPQAVPLQSVEVGSVDPNAEMVKVWLTFNDPHGTQNFYQIMAISIQEWTNPETGETEHYGPYNAWVESVDSELFDVVYSEGVITFNDFVFDGNEVKFPLRVSKYSLEASGVKLYFLFKSISEPYYEYIKTKDLQQNNSDNPFAQPVQVYNNIQNGLGIFAGYSTFVFEYQQ